MPGRPTLQKMEDAIQLSGGDDAVFTLVSAGEKVGAISEQLGVSRQYFYTWIKAGGEARKAAFEEAKRLSAHALAEKAQEVIETADASSTANVSLAKLRSEFYWKLAAARNREEYGEAGPQIQVNVNTNALHLDALRQLGHASRAIQTIPSEVISIGPESEGE